MRKAFADPYVQRQAEREAMTMKQGEKESVREYFQRFTKTAEKGEMPDVVRRMCFFNGLNMQYMRELSHMPVTSDYGKLVEQVMEIQNRIDFYDKAVKAPAK